ncbi:MAG: DUF2325 domain-containing protein [Proteobacteria bacterium]|nr:DUF2325 domain-containing protein [Pseudomonadota bacterium]
MKPDTNWNDGVLNVWEIDSIFKCPVVGACLTSEEQKRLLKKLSPDFRNKTGFEIHEVLVAFSDDENDLSRRLNRFLRVKYSGRIEGWMDLPESDFLREWKRVFEAGELDLAIYAGSFKPGLSVAGKKEIFGTIHMNMHVTAAANARLRSALTRAEAAARAAGDKREELSRINRELKKEIKKLKEARETDKVESSKARRESEALTFEIRQLKQAESTAASGNRFHFDPDREAGALKKVRSLELEISALERRAAELEKSLEQTREENRMIRRHLQSIVCQEAEAEPCDETCPSYDLCRKRILIVGGMTKMARHYREIVESRGGLLEYHDGNMKSGARALENRLKRSDLVLCPVDCNSHAACTLVKRLGKKHNKPVRMLSGSSLNAISQAFEPEWNEPAGIASVMPG